MEENSLETVTVNGIIKERNIVREYLEATDRERMAQLKKEMEYKQEEKKKNDRVLELIIECLSLHKQYYEELLNTQKIKN